MTKKRILPANMLVELASEVVQKGGRLQFLSRGYSMLPHIGDREKVTLSNVAFCDVKIGDVLLCTTADKPVLHRVIYKNIHSDPPFILLGSDVGDQVHQIRTSDVIGKVAKIKRSKRRMFKWHMAQMARCALLLLGPRPRLPHPSYAALKTTVLKTNGF